MMKRNQIISERLRQNNGFTLIEVIAVLIIIAIISAVVLVRGISTADVNLQAEVDILKSHLRYAQYLAMNDISPTKWGINFQGSSYVLIKDVSGVQTSPLIFPGESATHSFAAPITATATPAAPVLFDEWGSPTSATSIAVGGQTFTITATTGFIP
jgi:prepilin-type N-terminal cleavage/methylation domain-containing protein